jgi:hypothetical protein
MIWRDVTTNNNNPLQMKISQKKMPHKVSDFVVQSFGIIQSQEEEEDKK